MSKHLEVERKFDVVESTVSPSFDGLSAVTRVERSPSQSLDAVYFDTPGHDLAAHRITLRRRTGGSDAGWHLKLPAGPDARTEIRAPLGDGDVVPAELLDVVLAIVRDRPLGPVARITTNRAVHQLYGVDGTPLAEFGDDQVMASADGDDTEQNWREWELELVEVAAGVADDRCWTGWPTACSTRVPRRPGTGRNWRGCWLGGHRRRVPAPAAPIPSTGRSPSRSEQLLEWDRAVRADALRLGAPDAGGHAQDSQPAAGVGGRVRR